MNSVMSSRECERAIIIHFVVRISVFRACYFDHKTHWHRDGVLHRDGTVRVILGCKRTKV